MDWNEFMQQSGTDEEKVVKELVDVKNNLITKTELTHDQIVCSATCYHIAEKYNLPVISKWVERILQGMISKERKGRKEFIQALQSVREGRENLGFFGNMRSKMQ